jgi:hypothetical protein
MADAHEPTTDMAKAGEDLFNFAIDREDLKWLLERWPKESAIEAGTVEYELQILKIISVGWSLSYHLQSSPHKKQLLELYWNAVFEFARQLSSTTEMMTGQDIDYFEILKQRLDAYVASLAQKPDALEPARVIGPEFARFCGAKDDLFAFMAGSKMFIAATGRVGEYLDALGLK